VLVEELRIKMENPKLRKRESFPSAWYKFYPGFSESFARSILSSATLGKNAWVLDPWNGSGTTTYAASSLRLNSLGYDLNPAMVVVAKARSLDPGEYPSLRPVSVDLLRKSKKLRLLQICGDDPLLTWLVPSSASTIRGIEAAIQKLLIDDDGHSFISDKGTDTISSLAAFFYVALFRSMRNVLRPFRTSNPTWLKRPTSKSARLRPGSEAILNNFEAEVEKMLHQPIFADSNCAETILKVASSEKLPLRANSVDFILSSPPYCTRIDYAVATSAELAVLGFGIDTGFKDLRRRLMGGATVPKSLPRVSDRWGEGCVAFLQRLKEHGSKASSTYYYKNHLQYFHSLSSSVSEIGRVLRMGSDCVLVVQDSYYKDLHNDLPRIIMEMACAEGLALQDRYDFPLSRTMAGINPVSNGYRSDFAATESVLTFRKLQ